VSIRVHPWLPVWSLSWLAIFGTAVGLHAAEVIPPAPRDHFNDYAGVVPGATAQRLNAELTQFERETSNQIVVAVFPHMQSDSSIEDYTVRVAQAWHAGQQGKNNGAVLFAFMQEHKLYLQVGYGLEPVLPDATAKRIIEEEIVPRFRARDIDGGMTAAVGAMIAATKGEYKGTGRTHADGRTGGTGIPIAFLVVAVALAIVFNIIRRAATRPFVYLNPRRRSLASNLWWLGGGGGGGFGGFGGGGGGGGGGFSGGGGRFGGGGAGGSW